MQWPLLKSPNFQVSIAEYYIGLLSLGCDHNIARDSTLVRLDLCDMLWDSRLVDLNNGYAILVQWCQFVSIRYLMKGACRVTVMTVGDFGGYAPTLYILWGQLKTEFQWWWR